MPDALVEVVVALAGPALDDAVECGFRSSRDTW